MEKLLTPDEVCAIIPGMTRGLLAQMRYRGDGPVFIKASPKKVVYRESALADYLKAKERTSTATD